MVSHSKIAEYWMRKFINMETAEIISYEEYKQDKRHVNAELIITDIGEPCCWACGELAWSLEMDEDASFNQKWNNDYTKSRLQRCHIVGRQFGGSDDPSNLFLMCDKCHKESPDTNNPENFFLWVVERRKKGSWIDDKVKELMQVLEIKGIDMETLDAFIVGNKIDLGKVYKEALKRSGLHQFSISESSVYYNYADVCRELMDGRLDSGEYIIDSYGI